MPQIDIETGKIDHTAGANDFRHASRKWVVIVPSGDDRHGNFYYDTRQEAEDAATSLWCANGGYARVIVAEIHFVIEAR